MKKIKLCMPKGKDAEYLSDFQLFKLNKYMEELNADHGGKFDLMDYIDVAAGVYMGIREPIILRASAVMAYNRENEDVWCDVIMDDGLFHIVHVGFYLSDLWQVDGENGDLIRSKAYIRDYHATTNH